MVQRKIKKRIRKCGRDPSQPHHTAPGAEATPKTLAPFSPGLRASATSGPPAAMSWARVRVLEGTGADAPLRARAARVSAAARALLSAPAAACSPGRALGLGVGSARLRPPRRAPRPPSPWRLRGRRSRRWSRARGGRQRRRKVPRRGGGNCRSPRGTPAERLGVSGVPGVCARTSVRWAARPSTLGQAVCAAESPGGRARPPAIAANGGLQARGTRVGVARDHGGLQAAGGGRSIAFSGRTNGRARMRCSGPPGCPGVSSPAPTFLLLNFSLSARTHTHEWRGYLVGVGVFLGW